MSSKVKNKVKVTQVASTIGCSVVQKSNILGLGLKGIGKSKVLEATPSVFGMIDKVKHLLKVEKI